ARRVVPPSGLFTIQSTKAAAASAFGEPAATAKYIEALYQSSASAALPDIDGMRRISTVPPSELSNVTAWLDHCACIPHRPTANRLWSSERAASSTASDAEGAAPVSWRRSTSSIHCWRSSAA